MQKNHLKMTAVEKTTVWSDSMVFSHLSERRTWDPQLSISGLMCLWHPFHESLYICGIIRRRISDSVSNKNGQVLHRVVKTMSNLASFTKGFNISNGLPGRKKLSLVRRDNYVSKSAHCAPEICGAGDKEVWGSSTELKSSWQLSGQEGINNSDARECASNYLSYIYTRTWPFFLDFPTKTEVFLRFFSVYFRPCLDHFAYVTRVVLTGTVNNG